MQVLNERFAAEKPTRLKFQPQIGTISHRQHKSLSYLDKMKLQHK